MAVKKQGKEFNIALRVQRSAINNRHALLVHTTAADNS